MVTVKLEIKTLLLLLSSSVLSCFNCRSSTICLIYLFCFSFFSLSNSFIISLSLYLFLNISLYLFHYKFLLPFVCFLSIYLSPSLYLSICLCFSVSFVFISLCFSYFPALLSNYISLPLSCFVITSYPIPFYRSLIRLKHLRHSATDSIHLTEQQFTLLFNSQISCLSFLSQNLSI